MKILLLVFLSAVFFSIYFISFLLYGNNFTILTQSGLETIKYRNLVIDLDDGVK